jgi:hypothetical protein
MKSLFLLFATILISVVISAQTPVANAGSDTHFCGHTGELNAIITEGSGTWTSTLPAHVTISDPSDPESEVYCNIFTSGNPTYQYINLIWTVTLGEETDSDTVRVEFNRIPSNDIDYIASKCFGELFTIAASEDSLATYHWDFYGGIVESTLFNNVNGAFENLVRWENADTAHRISIITTNYWGCQSAINIDTVYEPIIPTFEAEIFVDSCLLGKGAIVFTNLSIASEFFWINNGIGPEYGSAITLVNNLPAGEYNVKVSYLTPNIMHYAYYINTFGTCNCNDTLHYEIVPDMVPEAVASVSMDVQLNNLFVPAYVIFVNHIVDFDFETTCHWNYGDGESVAICDQMVEHIYNTTGCFSPYLIVEVPAIEGCRDTAFIEPCLNIQEDGNVNQNGVNQHFNIYPNPTKNCVVVESDKYHISKIRIIDNSGKELVNIDNFDNEKIDISNLNSGYYRIIINSEGGEYNLPLIKQ